MAAEFGTEHEFSEQSGTDLGSRLANATEHAFSSGARRVVVIGTDCFDLNENHLHRSFDALERHDVVLGPATDGGYYLIGLSVNQVPLFDSIDWGSSRVFEQSRTIVQQCGTSLCELEILPDVDFPEDVLPLRRLDFTGESTLFECARGRISVIIPTLNEASYLPATLRSIGRPDDKLEIIVVDGGSTDETLAIASDFGAKAFVGNRSRAIQMNAGAAVATGDTLLFLHADTLLPDGYVQGIEKSLDDDNIAGAFRLRIDGRGVGLRAVEWGANLRSKLLQLPYGDQALFMRSKTFFELGGYRKLPIMDDFELVQRLRRIGKVTLSNDAVCTSSRRWKKTGILRTTIINQVCILAYRLGVSPERIAKLYRS